MSKKVLIAVDGSENSMKAVNYVSNIINPDDQVTIYSVLSRPAAVCDLDDPSLTPLFKENQSAFCAIENNRRNNLNEFMQKAKQSLLNTGISQNSLNFQIEDQTGNIANHILKKVDDEKFDTVVLGKRGFSKFTELLMGSISHKVAQLAKDIAVIIVT